MGKKNVSVPPLDVGFVPSRPWDDSHVPVRTLDVGFVPSRPWDVTHVSDQSVAHGFVPVRPLDESIVTVQSGRGMLKIDNRLIGRCKKFKCEQHSFDIKFDAISKTFGQAKTEITNMFVQLQVEILKLMTPQDFASHIFS